MAFLVRLELAAGGKKQLQAILEREGEAAIAGLLEKSIQMMKPF